MLATKPHPLKDLIARRIASGLRRSNIKSCSRWAQEYRVMGNPFPGKWNFDHHPWLLEMHDSDYDWIIGQKAAQMGYTEWAMNTAFYHIDVLGDSVLYVLPTSSDASDFSAGRFDPALELSPHLRDMFAETNNVGLKRAGTKLLYVRGSHSRSKLKSIPTPVLIFDEVDEMPSEAPALAEERQSGQLKTKALQLSTPTIDDFGINKEFKLSTEKYFFFRCPSCSRLTNLVYPECLVVTGESLTDKNVVNSHLICKECKNTLPIYEQPNGAIIKPWLKHRDRGGTAHFVETHTDREKDGFHVSQLYSMAKVGHPMRLAIAALKSKLDPTYAQEWFNSKLGLCFVAPGAKLTDAIINENIKGFHIGDMAEGKVRTMGIDVGAVLHIWIKEWTLIDEAWLPGLGLNDRYRCRTVYTGTSSGSAHDFDEAYELFGKYRVSACVVDAEPERRAALQFAQRLWGRVLLCDYLYSQMGREAQINEEEATIKVNRTSWLDLTLGRYKNGTNDLPVDISFDAKKQLKEPVRVFMEDKFGEKYGVYQNVGPDHFAHADNYAEIALPLAVSFGTNQDITELY